MCPRQYADLTGDRTNVRGAASIGTRAFFKNHVSDFRVLQPVEDELHMSLAVEIVGSPELIYRFIHQLIQAFLPCGLIRNHDGIPDSLGNEGLDLAREHRINLLRHHSPLGFVASQDTQLIDLGHNYLNFAMGQLDRLEHRGFWQSVRARFDHHHRVAGPGHDEMEIALLQRIEIGVHDKLAIYTTDFDTCDRSIEGNVRHSQC